MTDTATIEAPARTRKSTRRKKARRQSKAPAAAKVAMPDELAGLTAASCPVECRPKRCVISDNPYCGHPFKGGLQGSDLSDPAAIDRAHRARTAIAHQAADKRKS